jgi:hypothetical protein
VKLITKWGKKTNIFFLCFDGCFKKWIWNLTFEKHVFNDLFYFQPNWKPWFFKLSSKFSIIWINICSRASFHARQNSPFTRPWSAQSCSTALRRGCWPKGRRTNCSYLRGRFSGRYAAPKSKMVSTGEDNHELEIEFDTPNTLNDTKTSKLRYAGHMIRRPEDLPQKALFRAKPIGRRNQGRPKSRWADGLNSDSLALGVRDWTHCTQDRQLWKDLLGQAVTKYWL